MTNLYDIDEIPTLVMDKIWTRLFVVYKSIINSKITQEKKSFFIIERWTDLSK